MSPADLLELVGGPLTVIAWFVAALLGSLISFVIHPHNHHGRR